MTLWTCIRKVHGSNLADNTGYIKCSTVFLSPSRHLPGLLRLIRLRPLPFKPFPVHYSPVILPSTLTNVTQWQRRSTDYNYTEHSALAAVSMSEYCTFRSVEGSRFLHPHAQTAWLKTKHHNLSDSREWHVQHQKRRIFIDIAVRTSNLKQKFCSWNKIRSVRWRLVIWSVTAFKYQ